MLFTQKIKKQNVSFFLLYLIISIGDAFEKEKNNNINNDDSIFDMLIHCFTEFKKNMCKDDQ